MRGCLLELGNERVGLAVCLFGHLPLLQAVLFLTVLAMQRGLFAELPPTPIKDRTAGIHQIAHNDYIIGGQ
jgi:hypothetical protein